MAVKIATVILNPSAVRELAHDPGIAADMSRRAHRIADAAGGAPDFEVETGVTDRVWAAAQTATTKGRLAESQTRALTRAIDAGR